MDEEELKNETKENANDGNDILNGAGHTENKGTFTEKVKARIKSGAVGKFVKKAIVKSLAVVLGIILTTYVVSGQTFEIVDYIKDLTLVNMGQTVANSDSSNYSTTTGIGGKIAGQALAGLKNIANTVINFLNNTFRN